MTSPLERDTLAGLDDTLRVDDLRADDLRTVDLRSDALAAEVRRDRGDVLTVAEETATVGVERRETGGVRVRVVTETTDAPQRVDLTAQHVEVTRVPVEREITEIPAPRDEGDETIIPVVEERAVVVTKLFLTEEIRIRRVRSTETVDVPVNLRRQHAVVEQLEPGSDVDPGPVQAGLADR